MIIEKDVQKHIYNITLYVKQFIRSSEIEETPESFRQHGSSLGEILSSKYDERIILYDYQGEFIFDSVNKNGVMEEADSPKQEQNEISLAMLNKNAYRILNGKNNFIVSITVPIVINHQRVGIIQYLFYYNYLKDFTTHLFGSINIAIICIFIILFLFVLFFTDTIIQPIRDMKKATHRMARGHFDHELDIHTKDELEELADDFTMMKENIQKHIIELEVERDNLIRLHKHRKLFFDNVTHELKTPLTVISGYTQILREYQENDEALKNEILDRIKGESDRMHEMVLELLSVAKKESDMQYEFRVFNISDMVLDVIEAMQAKKYDKELMITKDIQENLQIYGDPLRIRQVIVNIIDNAIKYSTEKSELDIRVSIMNKTCHIVVKDKGIGIRQEHLEKIYRPFYRVEKQKRESSGLGLYIVKSILDRHNGKIKIDSQEDHGTEVHIEIPVKFTNG